MSYLTNPAVIILAVAALVILAKLTLHLSGRHGRGCTCIGCFNRNLAEARRQAYQESRKGGTP